MEIFEKICRFYILLGYKLFESLLDVFDLKINNDYIMECLKRFLCFYEIEGFFVYKDIRFEFELYYFLNNLGFFEVLNCVMILYEGIKNSFLFWLVLDIFFIFMFKNFV